MLKLRVLLAQLPELAQLAQAQFPKLNLSLARFSVWVTVSRALLPCTTSCNLFADLVCELLRGDQDRVISALHPDKYVWRTGGSLGGFSGAAAWQRAIARHVSKIRPIDIENTAAFRYPSQELRKAIDLVIMAAFGKLQQFRADSPSATGVQR
jgi:hypothetical protein